MLKLYYSYGRFKGLNCARLLSTVSGILVLLFSPVFLTAQNASGVEDKYEEAKKAFYLNETEKAEALFSENIDELCRNDVFTRECVEIHLFRAVIKRSEREFDEAERNLQIAEKILQEKRLEEDHLKVDLYIQYMYVYEENRNIEEAEKWVEKALSLAASPAMKGKPRARAFLGSGYLEDTKGNYEVAVEAYNRSLLELENIEKDLDVLKMLSQLYNNAGIAYRQLGKTEEAMKHYQLAMEVVTDIFGESHVEMAYIYNSIGAIHFSTGDFGTAADYFLRSAAIFESNFGSENQRVAGALNNAGLSYLTLEDLERATQYLEKAQQIKIEVLGKDHPETAIGYSNLGSIYLKNGNMEEAQNNYELSVEVREKVFGTNHPTLVDPLIQTGKLYVQNKNYSEGRKYFYRALDIARDRLGESHPVVADTFFELGDSYLEEKNPKEAEKYFNQVLTLLFDDTVDIRTNEFEAGHVTEPLLLVNTVKTLGELKMDRYYEGDDASIVLEALTYFDYAASVVDYLQTSYKSEASKLNLIEKNYSIYSKAIDALYILYQETSDQQWLDELLLFSEKSKARVALELFQNVEAKNIGGVPREVLEAERELDSVVSEYYQKLHLEKEKGLEADSKIIKAFEDSLFHAQQQIIRFTDHLEERYPNYYNLKYDRKLIDKERITDLLKKEESLLTYVIGEKSIYGLVICNGDISIHDLGETGVLAEWIEAIRKAVVAGNTEEYKKIAFSLYEKLIAPVRESINTKKVVIIPDQMLHYLPFEMLLSDSDIGTGYHELPYLIKDYQITYAPSATVLGIMTRQKPETPRNLLAMAPFYQGRIQLEEEMGMERYLADLSPLPLTRYETTEIARLFNTKRSFLDYIFREKIELLEDKDATKSRLMNEPVDDYGFIHFATHAFVHETNPSLSGLALRSDNGDNGIVYVNDIYNLQMNADLVVLGACETGLGSIYRGEGLIGFTRAFIYAGASNLLVSMWRVNDQPTANLMIEFYKNIREGKDYGESLQRAKLELINHPTMAAPRNWAAFVLNGR